MSGIRTLFRSSEFRRTRIVDLLEAIASAVLGALISEIFREIKAYVKSHRLEIYKRLQKIAESDIAYILAFFVLPLCASTLMFNQMIERSIPAISLIMNSFFGGSLIIPLFFSLSVSVLICWILDKYDLDLFYYDTPKWVSLLATTLPISIGFAVSEVTYKYFNADIRIVGDNLMRSSTPSIISLASAGYVLSKSDDVPFDKW